MEKHLEYPPLEDMNLQPRMKRLYTKLRDLGLYVKPVFKEKNDNEFNYFIVSLNIPDYEQDQG